MIEHNLYRTNIKNFRCPIGNYPIVKKGDPDSQGMWKGDVAYCKSINLKEVYDFMQKSDENKEIALYKKYGCNGLGFIAEESLTLSRRKPEKYEKEINGLYSRAKEAQEDFCVEW